MNDGILSVVEAVAVLIAAGYIVEEFAEPPELWLVNGEIMNGAELIDEALRTGLMDD
jgi:hypothetical protein